MPKMKKCPKCAGSGHLPQYLHVMRGECIPCRGTGEVEDRPERTLWTSRERPKKYTNQEILEMIRERLERLERVRGRSDDAVSERSDLALFIGHWFGELTKQADREFTLRVEARLKDRMQKASFEQAMAWARDNFGWRE